MRLFFSLSLVTASPEFSKYPDLLATVCTCCDSILHLGYSWIASLPVPLRGLFGCE